MGEAWASGTGGYGTDIFAEAMTWEIAGEPAASRKYPAKQALTDEVLTPSGQRFAAGHRFGR